MLHDEINTSRMVDATVRGASSMPSGKKQISSKTYFKDSAHILKKPKNMQRAEMIRQY
jgi:RAB protein geranylgeranyltransferase component A